MERSYMCNDEAKNNGGTKIWSTENEDQSCRLTWLPKTYGCSFCKRDFKSAQALGGHMNIHRRDRARLRQLHSWVLGSRKPNPNPNFTFSSFLSPSTEPSPYPAHSGKSFLTPPLACFSSLASVASTYKGKIQLPEYPQTHALATRKQKTVIADHDAGVLVAADHAENDIEMGFEDSKELLDLELRL